MIANNFTTSNVQNMYVTEVNRVEMSHRQPAECGMERQPQKAAEVYISEMGRDFNIDSEKKQEGISLCQTADGAMTQINDMLHRISQLSFKSANGVDSREDRLHIQDEINRLVSEIDRIGNSAGANFVPVLNTTPQTYAVQSVVSEAQAKIALLAGTYELRAGSVLPEEKGASVDISSLGICDLDVSTTEGASNAMEAVKEAMEKVSANQERIREIQSQFEKEIFSKDKLGVFENSTSEKAAKLVNQSRNDILKKADHAFMAQANQTNQSVLSLLS